MQEATFPTSHDLPLNEDARLPRLPERRSPFWQWADLIGRAVLLCLLAQTFLVQGYRVFGNCMEPNLKTGERVLGSKMALVQGVKRGDVVVFRPPHKRDTAFIKRVVALPGEIVEIRNNQVFINDRRLNEPYLHRLWHDNRPPERVASDKVFVMGDNRDQSNDSRMWGELPLNDIHAKAWLRYWPPERMGLIQ
jgi:signal peptidase I